MTADERLDRLEEIVAEIAARQGDGRVLGTPAMVELRREVRERVQARHVDESPLCQFTGAKDLRSSRPAAAT